MDFQKNLFKILLSKHYQMVFITKVIFAFFLLFILIMLTSYSVFPQSIIFQCFLGMLFVHMKELQHETLHNATRWKSLNRCLGMFLGMPMLVSYSDYKYFHMLHHRYVGTEKDTEYFTYSEKKTFSIHEFIAAIFMFDHYINVLKKMCNALLLNEINIKSLKIRHHAKQEYFIILFFLLSPAFLSIFYKNIIFEFLKLWITPLICFASPINFLIELPEHTFCNKNHFSIFHNTRTIKSNRLMSWFVNGNNYHVEHHLAPYVSFNNLPALHKEIKNKITYYNETYIDFYKKFFKNA